jgi:S1-C subfamily serine protease
VDIARIAFAASCAACGSAPDVPVVCPTAEVARPPSQCGPTLDFTPINSYQGELAIVNDREDAVVMLDGTCTGTLVAAVAGPVVLTAGHCVAMGERVLVVFNFEDAPDGDQLTTEGTVIESSSMPDYALVQLDTLPAVTPTRLATRPSDRLAIIQHPRGQPKVVAEGSFLDSCDGIVYYVDLDTLVGSSGAGVLNRDGGLIGVHTDGDCDSEGGGTNRGSTSASIVAASPYLQSEDLDP